IGLRLARKGFLEVGRDPEIDVLLLYHSDSVGNQAFIALGQQPYNVKHAAERTCCVGDSAEADYVTLVAWFKCLHEKLVRVRHVIGNAITERETDYPRPPLANSRKRVPRSHRAHPRVIVGNLSLIADQHLIELHHVRFLVAELIASTSQQITMFFAICQTRAENNLTIPTKCRSSFL